MVNYLRSKELVISNSKYFTAMLERSNIVLREVVPIMPLTMAQSGTENTVRKITGQDDTRRFLETLGFVEGGRVTVVSELGDNLIVNVKESRIALSKTMASRILVSSGK